MVKVNWRKSAGENSGHFNRWLVLPETQVMQIRQLESNLTDQLATGNWPLTTQQSSPSHKAHRAALISVLSRTPAYTARPRIRG